MRNNEINELMLIRVILIETIGPSDAIYLSPLKLNHRQNFLETSKLFISIKCRL